MFQYEFMRKSFIMGILIASIAPTIGYFLVLRRQSVIGDTLSHVALAGAALGMILNIYPVYMALVFSLLGVFLIELLRKKYKDYAELSLSIVLSAGVGLASIFLSLGNTQGVMSYLFGSLSLVTNQDLVMVVALWVVILYIVVKYYRELFYITFDEESAFLSGVNVRRLNAIFSVLVALTVAISMRIVGVLLISSLMVIPVAASLLIAGSFKTGLIYSNIFGIISVLVGLVVSYYFFDTAPGGTIVMVSLICLIGTIIYSKYRK